MKEKRSFKQYKPLNVALTVVFIIAVALLIITCSIGVPIYFRFLYYIQIKTLGMEKATGWDYATIKGAYDDVLNYLTLPGRQFGTGKLKWSEDGAAHFADCKVLFDLNFWVMLVSAAITATLAILHRFNVITVLRPFGHRAYFLAAIIAVVLPVVVGIACAIDFDKAFEVFHTVFFPGKTNWMFDPRTDQIIDVMPEQFFMNCAIIIGVTLVAIASSLVTADIILTHKEKKNKKGLKTQ